MTDKPPRARLDFDPDQFKKMLEDFKANDPFKKLAPISPDWLQAKPPAIPKPPYIFGYWQGSASGAILKLADTGDAKTPIAITGTAFNEQIEGTGRYDGRIRLSVRLKASGREITLDL